MQRSWCSFANSTYPALTTKNGKLSRDKIQEASEDKAAEMGLLHLYKGSGNFDPDQLSEEELQPWKAYKTALGELTPIAEVLPVWLETIGNKKTRSDYRRAVEVLAQRFTTLEEVDRRKAKQFLEWAKRENQITNPTLRKWMSGYKNLWEYADKDISVWNDQKLSADPPRAKKRPFHEHRRSWRCTVFCRKETTLRQAG